jgi:hypothetical protein
LREQIASGKLALHTLRGVIIERIWGSVGDRPEIKVENDTGLFVQKICVLTN